MTFGGYCGGPQLGFRASRWKCPGITAWFRVDSRTNQFKAGKYVVGIGIYIEDIYFFEVNTKYISSSAVKKISIFHECVARVKMLIFSPHEMKYF